jgi:hypothetical protein
MRERVIRFDRKDAREGRSSLLQPALILEDEGALRR